MKSYEVVTPEDRMLEDETTQESAEGGLREEKENRRLINERL